MPERVRPRRNWGLRSGPGTPNRASGPARRAWDPPKKEGAGATHPPSTSSAPRRRHSRIRKRKAWGRHANCEQDSTNRKSRDESQWIVAQRLLSHLQYPDATKSSAWDLSPSPIVLAIEWRPPLPAGNHQLNGGVPISFPVGARAVEKHCLFSMDSDLEAFSRNPAHGSIAVLAFQLAAFTNYANRVFLSY